MYVYGLMTMAADGELSEGELEEGELLSSDEEQAKEDKQPPTIDHPSTQPNDHEKHNEQRSAKIDKQKTNKHTGHHDNEHTSDDGEIFSDDEEAAYYPERVKSRSVATERKSPEKSSKRSHYSDSDNRTSDRESTSHTRGRQHSRDTRERWQMSPVGSESSREESKEPSLFFEDREGGGRPSDNEDNQDGREKRRSWDRERPRDRHYSSPTHSSTRQHQQHSKRDGGGTRGSGGADRSEDFGSRNRDSSYYNRGSGGYGGRKVGGYVRQRPYGIKSSRFTPYETSTYTPPGPNMSTGMTAQQIHLLAEKVASRREQGLPLLPTPSRKPKFTNLDQFNYPAAPSWYTEAVEEWEERKKKEEVALMNAASEVQVHVCTSTEGDQQTTVVPPLAVTDVSSDEEGSKTETLQHVPEGLKPEPLMGLVTVHSVHVHVDQTITDHQSCGSEEDTKMVLPGVSIGVSQDHQEISETQPTSTTQPEIKPLFAVSFDSPNETLPQDSNIVVPPLIPPTTTEDTEGGITTTPTPTGGVVMATPTDTGGIVADTPTDPEGIVTTTSDDLAESSSMLVPPPAPTLVEPAGSKDKEEELMDTLEPTHMQPPSLASIAERVVNQAATFPDGNDTSNVPPTTSDIPLVSDAPVIITPTDAVSSDRPTNDKSSANYQFRPRPPSTSATVPGASAGFRPKVPSDSDNEVSYEDYLDQLDQEEEEEEDGGGDDVIPNVFGDFPLANTAGGTLDQGSNSVAMSISDLISGGQDGDVDDDPLNEDFPAISTKKEQSDQSLLSLMGHTKSKGSAEDEGERKMGGWGGKSGRRLHKKSAWKARQQERDKQKQLAIQEKAQMACKYFLSGNCKNGESCRYKHDVTAVVQPQKKNEICKFYLQDSCSKGDSCNYCHGEFPCKFFHTKGHCKNGSLCKFSHSPLTQHTRELLNSVLDQPLTDPSTSSIHPILPITAETGTTHQLATFRSAQSTGMVTAATTVSELDRDQLVVSIPKHIAALEECLIVSIPLSRLPPRASVVSTALPSQPIQPGGGIGTGNQEPILGQPPSLFQQPSGLQPLQGIPPGVPPPRLPPPQSQPPPIPLFPQHNQPPPSQVPTATVNVETPAPPVIAAPCTLPPGPPGPPRKVLLATPPPHTKISPQEFMRMKPVEYWEAPEISKQQQNQQPPPKFVENAPVPPQRVAPPPQGGWHPPPAPAAHARVNQPPQFQGRPPPSQQWNYPPPATHETSSTVNVPPPGPPRPAAVGGEDPRYGRTDPRRVVGGGGPPDPRRVTTEGQQKHLHPRPAPPSVEHGGGSVHVQHTQWPTSVSPPPPSTYHHPPPHPPSGSGGAFGMGIGPGSMSHSDTMQTIPPQHGQQPLSVDVTRSPTMSQGHMSPPQQYGPPPSLNANKLSPIWGKSPEHASSGGVGGAAADHVRRVDPRRKYSHLKIKSKGAPSSSTAGQSTSILKRGGEDQLSSGPGFKIPKLLQNPPSAMEKPLDPLELFGEKDGDTHGEYGDITAPFGTFKSTFFSQSQGSSTSQERRGKGEERSLPSSQEFGEITLKTDKLQTTTADSSDTKEGEKSIDESDTKVQPKPEVPSYFAHLDMGLDSDLKIDSAFGALSEDSKTTGSDSTEGKVQESQARKLPSIFGLGL